MTGESVIAILREKGLYFVDSSLILETSLMVDKLVPIAIEDVKGLNLPEDDSLAYIVEVKDYKDEDNLLSLFNFIKEVGIRQYTLVILVETYSRDMDLLQAQGKLYDMLKSITNRRIKMSNFTLRPDHLVGEIDEETERHNKVIVFGDNLVELDDDYEVIKTVYGRSLVQVLEVSDLDFIEVTLDNIDSDVVPKIVLIHTGSHNLDYERLIHIVSQQAVPISMVDLTDDSCSTPPHLSLLNNVFSKYQSLHLGNGEKSEPRLIRLLATYK